MANQVNKTASRTLDFLTKDLEVGGENRKIDNGGAGIMAVVVECIGKDLYSVAHYYEQNGDLMADPEITYWRTPIGAWMPVTYTQHNLGIYQEAILFDGCDAPQRFSSRLVRDISKFTNDWMKNIREQQELKV
jgi:hypothetical protein